MGLVDFARKELERAGLFDKDSDYDGAAGEAVLELVKTFAAQGHSGASAALVLAAFDKVARCQPLAPLTADPAEWMEVGADKELGTVWQSVRQPSAFSHDGGKTWYDVDDPERKLTTSAPAKAAAT